MQKIMLFFITLLLSDITFADSIEIDDYKTVQQNHLKSNILILGKNKNDKKGYSLLLLKDENKLKSIENDVIISLNADDLTALAEAKNFEYDQTMLSDDTDIFIRAHVIDTILKETGLKIEQQDLHLLSISRDYEDALVAISADYVIVLNDISINVVTPRSIWVPLSSIKYKDTKEMLGEKYHIKDKAGHNLFLNKQAEIIIYKAEKKSIISSIHEIGTIEYLSKSAVIFYTFFIIPFSLIFFIITIISIIKKFRMGFVKTSKIPYFIFPFVIWCTIYWICLKLSIIPKDMGNVIGEPIMLSLITGIMLLLNIVFNMFFDKKYANKIFITMTNIMAFLLCLLC